MTQEEAVTELQDKLGQWRTESALTEVYVLKRKIRHLRIKMGLASFMVMVHVWAVYTHVWGAFLYMPVWIALIFIHRRDLEKQRRALAEWQNLLPPPARIV